MRGESDVDATGSGDELSIASTFVNNYATKIPLFINVTILQKDVSMEKRILISFQIGLSHQTSIGSVHRLQKDFIIVIFTSTIHILKCVLFYNGKLQNENKSQNHIASYLSSIYITNHVKNILKLGFNARINIELKLGSN